MPDNCPILPARRPSSARFAPDCRRRYRASAAHRPARGAMAQAGVAQRLRPAWSDQSESRIRSNKFILARLANAHCKITIKPGLSAMDSHAKSVVLSPLKPPICDIVSAARLGGSWMPCAFCNSLYLLKAMKAACSMPTTIRPTTMSLPRRCKPCEFLLHPYFGALQSFRSLLGISTTNRVPSPSVLSTATLPPCAATMLSTMLSPSPVPPASRVRALSAR